MEKEMHKEMQKAVDLTRENQPFVPSMTNVVTVNPVTNAQIAIGVSPAVFYQGDEGEHFADVCGALYINLGTLFQDHKEAVPKTIKALEEAGKPWLLDPVGVGKGSLHGELIDFIQNHPPTIIKGNASEILKLGHIWQAKASDHSFVGVDAKDTVQAAKASAIALAQTVGSVVTVTGPIDFITDGDRHFDVSGGSSLMQDITGAGCMVGGVMAGYLASAQPLVAALTAAALFNQASEKASQDVDGPASFQTKLLDTLYQETKAGKIDASSVKELQDDDI